MTVALKVGGLSYSGWKAVSITAGIERAAREFQFPATEVDPAEASPVIVRPGAACVVTLDDEVVCTGYVDDVDPSFDSGGMEVSIDGRSRTQDAVDCSASSEPGRWTQTPLEVIASALVAPFGIVVRVEAPTGLPIPRFRVQSGEKVVDALERLARLRGLLVTDDELGNLVLTRAGALQATTALVVGENILAGAANFSAAEVYNEYRCKGQTSGGDFVAALTAAQPSATVFDDTLPGRNRVLEVVPEDRADSATCLDRARWEAVTRAARSMQVTYTVQGWRQGDGTLWRPNMLVAVKDHRLRVNGELLITEITYSEDDQQGQLARLQVCPAAAFELLSPRELEAAGVGIRQAAGVWS